MSHALSNTVLFQRNQTIMFSHKSNIVCNHVKNSKKIYEINKKNTFYLTQYFQILSLQKATSKLLMTFYICVHVCMFKIHIQKIQWVFYTYKKISPCGLTTHRVFNSHMWLVATVTDTLIFFLSSPLEVETLANSYISYFFFAQHSANGKDGE